MNTIKKSIEKIASNKGFVRFLDDKKFRVNDKPDLLENQNYKTVTDTDLR